MSRNSFHVFVLIVSSFIISVILAEFVLQVLPGPDEKSSQHREVIGGPLHERDPLLGWRTVPNVAAVVKSLEYEISVHNNASGIRGPDYADERIENEIRVLAIGDSFTAGYTVDYVDTFGQVAQRDLNSQKAERYKIITAGTEAYSTDQELLFLKNETEQYRADITVLMFFYNDIWFNTQPFYGGEEFGWKPLFELDAQGLTLAYTPGSNQWKDQKQHEFPPSDEDSIETSVSITLRAKRWLNDHSRLYRTVRRVLKDGIKRSAIPLRDVWFLHPLPDQNRVFQTSYSDEVRMAWTMTESLIKEIASEVLRRHGQFLLFHVPPRESVYDDVWNKAMEFHDLNPAEWRADQVEIELRRICTENNFDCILPTAVFREQASKLAPERLYLIGDPHWNRAGHKLAGELLAEYVQTKLRASLVTQYKK